MSQIHIFYPFRKTLRHVPSQWPSSSSELSFLIPLLHGSGRGFRTPALYSIPVTLTHTLHGDTKAFSLPLSPNPPADCQGLHRLALAAPWTATGLPPLLTLPPTTTAPLPWCSLPSLPLSLVTRLGPFLPEVFLRRMHPPLPFPLTHAAGTGQVTPQ